MATVTHIGHFQYCPPVLTPTPLNTIATIPVSLEEAMNFVWRIKAYSFSVSGGSLLGQSSFFDDYPFFTEKNLVCNTQVPLGVWHTAYGETTQTPPENDWSVSIGLVDLDGETGTISSQIVSFGDDSLYLAIIGGINGEIIGEFAGSVTNLGNCTFQFNAVFFDGSITITATPSEWWPYDPDDGEGPIYNSLTGERIRFDV